MRNDHKRIVAKLKGQHKKTEKIPNGFSGQTKVDKNLQKRKTGDPLTVKYIQFMRKLKRLKFLVVKEITLFTVEMKLL